MKEKVTSVIGLYICIEMCTALLSPGCRQRENNIQKVPGQGTKLAAAWTKADSAMRPGSPIQYDRSRRYIFLTFDDAPQLPGTINCESIFSDQGVKATFFLVGLHMEMDRLCHKIVDSLRRTYPHFLIANHSYSHGFRNHYQQFYARPDSAIKDFLKAEAILQVPVRIARLPGNNCWVGIGENKGSHATMEVRNKLASLGYNVIGWDVEWHQGIRNGRAAPIQPVSQMVNEINYCFDHEKTNQPGAIVILAHDRMFARPQYADSLARFIAILKQDPRNVFETIDHYPLVQRQLSAEAPVIAYADH